MDRRTFNTAFLSAATTSAIGYGSAAADGRTVLYQAVGDRLIQWDVDVDAATLTSRGSVTLPSNIQYVWPHPSRQFLYVSTSDAASGNAPNPGKVHCLCALSVDATGAVSMHGEPARLPQRPIHNSVDAHGEYALTCYNNPSNLTVHRISGDGSVGAHTPQEANLDYGIFAHQILSMPSNRTVIMVTRGNRPESNKAEDPGALKVYAFNGGQLSPLANLPVGGNGGLGYGPRHLDFHPSGPWVYVVLERQNEVETYRLEDGSLTARAVFRCSTLADPEKRAVHQLASAIQVHPNGHYLYVSNRADGVVDFRGKKVFAGGENNIAVYSINQATGEPTALQFIDTPRISPRSFDIEPGGRLMVVHNNIPANIREGEDVKAISAGMSVYRIGHDGKLTYVRTYDLEGGKYTNYWLGIVQLP